MKSCSFDNKTGIWKNEKENIQSKNQSLASFKELSIGKSEFKEEIPIKKNFKFLSLKSIQNYEWTDQFYNESNNFINFKYNDTNKIILKSKKITRQSLNKHLLSIENNIIFSDSKGNIFIFSLDQNKIIQEFNFYKKKYKKIKKNLNLILENNIIYVSDNLGYLYALDYKRNFIIWAKNYKIPFRSNLKLSKDSLITSNQNNNLYFFDKKNGEILKIIPTEETIIKNKFINNLSSNMNYVFFLNTYGSLYAIDKKKKNIVWFLNLNQSIDINPSNLFLSNQIINHENKIIISSNEFLYILDASTGAIIHKKNFTSIIKPLIIEDYLFLVSKKSFLIAMNLINGEIIYAYDLNKRIANFLNSKQKEANFKDLFMFNNQLYLYLNNSFFLKLKKEGEILNIGKLPDKINSEKVIINSSIFFINKKNKIVGIN